MLNIIKTVISVSKLAWKNFSSFQWSLWNLITSSSSRYSKTEEMLKFLKDKRLHVIMFVISFRFKKTGLEILVVQYTFL